MRQYREAESYSGRSIPRRVSRRHLIAGVSVAGAGIALAGCRVNSAASNRATSSTKGTPKRGGQIRVRLTEDPQDWDVSLLGKGSADGIFFAYDNLVAFKSGADVAYA